MANDVVYPNYNYGGVCKQYATYGRVRADDFAAAARAGKVLHSIDLSAAETFYYGADYDSDDDPKREPDTSTFELSRPVKYKGVDALHLSGVPAEYDHPSVNPREPNPYIGGLGIGYSALPVNLTTATHVQIKVFPRTSSTLLIEIYENDGGDPKAIDKNPKNFWLPEKDDDFWKVTIKLVPNGKWQTLTIPIAKFVDWNKKINCPHEVKGVNENIGNGIFDPKKGEAMDFQLTFVSDSWGPEAKDIYVGKEVKFLKIK
jgi:hypothetical protein